MRNKKINILLVIGILSALLPVRSSAEPITYYQYITNFEVTRFDEIIWFWSYDTMEGPVRSNDYIALKYSPHFYDHIYTSKEEFIYYCPGNIYFEYEPHFRSPPFPFPESYPHLIELADVHIDDDDGRFITRVALKGEDGIDIHQLQLGQALPAPGDEDNRIRRLRPPDWQVLCIDGKCEVYGVLSGRLTVYSSDNMYLIDNILYEGADTTTGIYDDDEMEHILGLVSDRNIIIRNNERNGRNNGFRRGQWNRVDKHSIIVNGSLVALGESFRFEQQNDDWEPYQGPSPDERGIIHHKGGIAQWRRGYIHRSNHGGTGYGWDRHYDNRLRRIGPPGFDPNFYPEVSGRFDKLDLAHGPYNFRGANVGNLTIHPGVEITLYGNDALHVRDTLRVLGTEAEPVIFRTEYEFNRGTVWADPAQNSIVDIRHARFTPYVSLRLDHDNIAIEDCIIGGLCHASGNVRIRRSTFAEEVELTSYGSILIEKCMFEGGISIRGNVRDGRLINNTIVHSRGAGVELRRFRSMELVNNIIAFNLKGIENHNCTMPLLRYNDVYGHRDGNYIECEPGEGCISEHPRFADQVRGDFRLNWGSPCIDAGDPDFPSDPDGSRADMGAFCFDHEHFVNPEPTTPLEFDLNVSPNPFNRRTELHIQAIISGLVYIKVFDLQGRRVYEDVQRISVGKNRIALDGRQLGGAGVYMAQVMTFGETRTVKLVYLP